MSDIEQLVAQMVEFEHHRILFAAIRTRMLLEELDQKDRSLKPQLSLGCRGLVDVALLVRLVVLSLVCGAAWTAHVVQLSDRLASPVESSDRFELAAPAT